PLLADARWTYQVQPSGPPKLVHLVRGCRYGQTPVLPTPVWVARPPVSQTLSPVTRTVSAGLAQDAVWPMGPCGGGVASPGQVADGFHSTNKILTAIWLKVDW